jgi:cell division protein FtsB
MYRLREWLRHESLTLMLGVLLAIAMLNLVAAPHGLRDLLLLRHHRARLEAEREQRAAEQRQLQATIGRLESDDAYIQRFIRKELGYARANELIYRFANDSSTPSSPNRP